MKKFLVLIISLFCLSTVWAQNFALEFDGTNDKIVIPDNASLNPTNAITLEAWINVAEWDTNIYGDNIICKQQSGTPDCGYNLTCGENGKVQFTISAGAGWNDVSTGSILGLNQWYHVAGVYDGASMKIFVNGIMQSEIAVTDEINISSNDLNLGENPEWTNRMFNGTLDEVRIWNVARTDAEIQSAMNTELVGDETGLGAYYNFNEGAGTDLNDISSNTNNGVLTNMTESAWVDGFVSDSKDIEVGGIVSPTWADESFSGDQPIKIEIKNNSGVEVSGITASYAIDGGTPIEEELTGIVIPSLSSYIFDFSQTTNLSGLTSVDITATVSMENDINGTNDTITENITLGTNLLLFDGITHNNSYAGQRQKFVTYFPDNLDNVEQIILTIDMECPTLGCDPWDQPAQMLLHKDGKAYELARYVTPFGIACGPWTYDITDFRDVLKGKVEFESFIQVWGSSGWDITAEIDLVEGTPEYNRTIITPLWSDFNFVYGDTTISYDLDAQTVAINPLTEDAVVRLTNTGHGQGNTYNAMEFYETTPHLWVNGTQAFEHHLWKTDCATNECTAQQGTYTYSRAGWCPGQDIQPMIWSLNEYFTAGQNIDIDYVLQDYTNLLSTGYDGSSHTEPHYKIYAYLIESYNDETSVPNAIQDFGNLTVYPNPTDSKINIRLEDYSNTEVDVRLVNVFGQEIVTGAFIGFDYSFDVSNLNKGLYLLEISTKGKTHTEKIAIQ
jgi:hypothetical protein